MGELVNLPSSINVGDAGLVPWGEQVGAVLNKGTSAATPSTLAARDAFGRLQVADPANAADATTKGYVDYTLGSALASLPGSSIGAVVPPVPLTIVARDSSGRSQFADPAAAQDAATMNYQLNQVLHGRGVVYLYNYPRLGGETDDSGSLTRAIADAASKGANVIELGGAITLNTQVNCNVSNMTFRGSHKTGCKVTIGADVIAFNVTGSYVCIENLHLYNSVVGRTQFPVQFNNTALGRVNNCYIDSISGGRFHGVYFLGASSSMGIVENCVFSHACIRIETWDVKVRNSWIWAMSNDYGVGIFNGAGNTDLVELDIVPPLQSTATGIAAILIDGTTGATFNTKLNTIFLDGNPSLNTRKGIYMRSGCGGINMYNIHASRMDDDVITIDSCYNVLVNGYNGYNNNNTAAGTGREIVVTKTGTQSVESIRLSSISCLQTAAAVGTVENAIYVDDSVGAWQVSIDGFNIKQPGAGGGYLNPEVRVPKDTNGYPTMSMKGKGQLTLYAGDGNQLVTSGSTTATVNLGNSPFALAYRPNPSRIRIGYTSTAVMPAYRISYNSDNQIVVTFASALTADTTLFWHVDFITN